MNEIQKKDRKKKRHSLAQPTQSVCAQNYKKNWSMKRDSPTSGEEKRAQKEALLWEQRDYSKTHCQTWISSIFKLRTNVYICVKRIRSESKITDILFDETCAITHAQTQTQTHTHTRGKSERHTHAKLTHSWCHPKEYIQARVYIHVYGYVLRIRFSILLSLFNFIFIWPISKNAKPRRWCFKHLWKALMARQRRGRSKERSRVTIWSKWYRFQRG